MAEGFVIGPTHYMLLSAALFIIGVIGVMVRVEHVLHRQRRDRRDLLHQPAIVLVARILRVDDDEPVRGDADERVGPSARHHIEVGRELPDFLDRLPRRRPALTPARPPACARRR